MAELAYEHLTTPPADAPADARIDFVLRRLDDGDRRIVELASTAGADGVVDSAKRLLALRMARARSRDFDR